MIFLSFHFLDADPLEATDCGGRAGAIGIITTGVMIVAGSMIFFFLGCGENIVKVK